ncbi:hypothetical protein F441_22972 [Phytophthora nicotianae CJ01A1]|uniref:Uncharacterized protein n=2 Tax=Phytophthora nicotianae TaxID=4792 RepID=W2Y4P5_PHYNI|nr:hypothetical protein F441_22972 [Phytophthora nicotianae CJ01A1]ETP30085.1 hypothetical protein F442_20861 [Phytophthora nicotianae P10297]
MSIHSDDYVIFMDDDVITDAPSSTTSLRAGSGHFPSISPLFPKANCHFTTIVVLLFAHLPRHRQNVEEDMQTLALKSEDRYLFAQQTCHLRHHDEDIGPAPPPIDQPARN